MKETNESALDALALFRAWDKDAAGYTLFVGKASPEALRDTLTHVMVLAKMLALRPDGQDVEEFLDRYEFELRRDLESGA